MIRCRCKDCRPRRLEFAIGLSLGAILGTTVGWLCVEIGVWLNT